MSPRPTAASFGERLRWGARMTAQGLRRHRAVFFVSAAGFAVATAALAACFAVAQPAASTASAAGTAQLVAFLDDALPTVDRDALATALGQLPGVAGVRVLPSDEALGRMRAELGPRAPLLDGVEEGFLPTTLEIALRPGRQGVGRADELAWRLRHMAGISDVDVLRSEADHRLITEQETSRRLRIAVFAGAGLLALAALLFVAALARRRRADAIILDGLGFTSAAVAGPAFAASAAAAGIGVAAVLLAARLLARLALAQSFPGATLARGLVGPRAEVAVVLAATLLGGAMGWWGTRVPASQGDELAPGT